jgi:hypothetical protein
LEPLLASFGKRGHHHADKGLDSGLLLGAQRSSGSHAGPNTGYVSMCDRESPPAQSQYPRKTFFFYAVSVLDVLSAGVETALSFLVMLAVMSFHAGIFMSAIIGACIAHLVYPGSAH